MKNFLIIISVFSLLIFVSCSNFDLIEKKDNKIELTSDEGLNIRASTNYENISLDSLEILPLQLQREIFIVLSPAKRLELWIARMNKAKQSLNSNQILNLVPIENLFNVNYFSDSLSNSNEQFINNWVNQMVADSVWNKKDIYYLLCTFTPVGDTSSAAIPGGPDHDNDIPECNCNSDFYCNFLSGLDQFCDKKSKCTRTYGCGWNFLKPCRGICSVYTPG